MTREEERIKERYAEIKIIKNRAEDEKIKINWRIPKDVIDLARTIYEKRLDEDAKECLRKRKR